MIRTAMFCAATAAAGVLGATAEECALQFKTIEAKEVMAFPGGYGIYGQLRLAKPGTLKKEPKPISTRPLYGECDQDDRKLLFRLDESGGEGKGYDQLIVDMNRNGDLTDDVAVGRVTPASDVNVPNRPNLPVLFGPVPAPAGQEVAGGQPLYYARAYINRLPAGRSGQDMQNLYAGQLMLKAAWYLEGTVQLKEGTQKIGVFDGDSNLRLGDFPKPREYSGDGQKSWYFQPGDRWLVDLDGSGAFETDPVQSETPAFGSILYLKGQPYKASLTADCQSLRLEACPEPLAEVALQPAGDQVSDVTLAWQHPGNQWQLVVAQAVGGKLKVPPGKYRLYATTLRGKAADARDQVMVAASQRTIKSPVTFAGGKANTLRCGAPLTIDTTAEKRVPQSWELPDGASKDPKTDSDYIVRINATLEGGAGEIYSTFAKGRKFEAEPPKPTFTVRDSTGKKLANGNLEFG